MTPFPPVDPDMPHSDPSETWAPSATLETLRARADALRTLRQFFADRSVLEVDTPLWARHGVTDVHLDNVRTTDGGCLLTSPEYPMKRLLAAGLGDIYQLSHVLRPDETGPRHNLEFTMLEWYRLGWDDERLIDEVADLCRTLAGDPDLPVERRTFETAFARAGLPDPHRAPDRALAAAVRRHLDADADDWSREACLDALMALVVEPSLSVETLTFITRYPASQAALARLEREPDGTLVARRFELYWRGMELANGYWELTDAREQTRRFEADRSRRRADGRHRPEVDPYLLAAMEAGLPACAGVALGVDRLLMILLGKDHIREVLPFASDRV